VGLGAYRSSDSTWSSVVVGYPLITLGAVFLLLGVWSKQTPEPRTKVFKSFVHLGKVSYGIYAYHPICIAILMWLIPTHKSASLFVLRFLLIVAIDIAVALLSYHYFEAWFLRLKKKFSYVLSAPLAN
jgi:peptidoglycan/LPS O-acetylase OafA/YrhL